MVFMFLPPYSPNLNLIERLWKFMRKKIINNQYYETFKEFKKEIDSFFKGLPSKRHELRQFIGIKLRLFQAA
ncbi:MAG: transposase [Leptolinea sp.]